ncbi:unnamed protein product [Rotaria magnacalcarata]|uniref:Uncharacterized protein n=1 Tax=Rotaria magnacalcarata TaxID=392030 RepID=A0A816VQ84_9BILA|nr:unnamed protein product [Rotaria magnacalcarata]CAF4066821.1 unnamed protein product [Rotaria magnacalcarata]
MNTVQSSFMIVEQAWHCQHGSLAAFRVSKNFYGYRCCCPPNFYGYQYQYQNQRVSVRLTIKGVDPDRIYGFLITLIEDDDDRQEIHSYQQLTFVSRDNCGKNFTFLLLYSTWPKNTLKNYSLGLDAFDKISLKYLTSWHFRIPFTFLPVNYLPIVITVPAFTSPALLLSYRLPTWSLFEI